VLAIHGQNVHAVIARFAHHDLACHYQNFLARHREIFSGFNRGERRSQPAGTDDCNKDHVSIRQARNLAQANLAQKNPRLVIERLAQDFDLRFINQAKRFRPEVVGSRSQFFGIAVGRQADDLHSLRNIARDLQRAFADRSGRA
jgi:hypothetical protein